MALKKDGKKEQFLEALFKLDGHISNSCRAVGIGRTLYYEWCKRDPEFNQKAQDIFEHMGDEVENMLMRNIREGKETSTIFYCKTKLKDRGYVERQEQHLSGGLAIGTQEAFINLLDE